MASFETISNSIKEQLKIDKVDVGIILGSGLGSFTQSLKNSKTLSYQSIEGFPSTSVAGHAGELVYAEYGGKSILCYSGRFHPYEGYPIETTTLPVKLLPYFSASHLIVTNAAGGVRFGLHVGDLMIIRSMINIQGRMHSSSSKSFYTDRYNRSEILYESAFNSGINITSGTYLYTKGPNYETPSEIKAFRTIGADAVGMSTYAELIEAERCELPYVAVSLITNLAAGMGKGKLDHSDIKDIAAFRSKDISALFLSYIRSL